jgi:hypothetical protein
VLPVIAIHPDHRYLVHKPLSVLLGHHFDMQILLANDIPNIQEEEEVSSILMALIPPSSPPPETSVCTQLIPLTAPFSELVKEVRHYTLLNMPSDPFLASKWLPFNGR